MEPILRPSPNLYEYWMFLVLIIGLIFLALIRFSYHRRIFRLLSGVWRLQMLRQLLREEPLLSHRAALLLLINFIMVFALLLYLYIQYYGRVALPISGIVLFGAIAVLIGLGLLIKLVAVAILRWLFDDRGLLKEYNYFVFQLYQVLGIFLLPAVGGLVYLNIGSARLMFVFAAIILGASVLFRLIQGVVMCTSYAYRGVYIILYLCTLEILPLALILRAIVLQVSE